MSPCASARLRVRHGLPLLLVAAFPLLPGCGDSPSGRHWAAVKDKDKAVRAAAADILGKLGAAAKPALPALKEAAKDPDADVKVAVQKALDAIGG